MEYKDILTAAKYSTEKMQKINLFETRNFFCDIYCLEPGQEQKVHAHHTEDKIYLVLEGYGEFIVDDESIELGENKAVFAPAGSNHGVRNRSKSRLRLLVFMTPNPNFSS